MRIEWIIDFLYVLALLVAIIAFVRLKKPGLLLVVMFVAFWIGLVVLEYYGIISYAARSLAAMLGAAAALLLAILLRRRLFPSAK